MEPKKKKVAIKKRPRTDNRGLSKALSKAKWLLCRVEKGMFPDEVIASFRDAGYIIKASMVREDHKAIKVKATKSNNDKYVALLPTEYGELIEVDSSELQEA